MRGPYGSLDCLLFKWVGRPLKDHLANCEEKNILGSLRIMGQHFALASDPGPLFSVVLVFAKSKYVPSHLITNLSSFGT